MIGKDDIGLETDLLETDGLSGDHEESLVGTKDDSEVGLKRRKSMKPTDIHLRSMPEAGTREFDVRAKEEMTRLFDWVKELSEKVTLANVSIEQSTHESAQYSGLFKQITKEINSINSRLSSLTQTFQLAQQQQDNLKRQLHEVAKVAGAYAAMSKSAVAAAKDKLIEAIRDLNTAERNNFKARPDDKTSAEAQVNEKREELVKCTLEYLALNAKEKYGDLPQNLPMVKIEKLQQQLAESIRKNRSDKPVAGWSWRTMFSTDKNDRALASVERLASNAAFSNPGPRTDDKELKVNADIIELMMLATYALSNFSKIMVLPSAQSNLSAQAAEDDLDDGFDGEEIPMISTPPQKSATPARNQGFTLSASKAEISAKKSSPLKVGSLIDENHDEEIHQENAINKAVIDVIRQRLAEIQKRADGLIGTQNPNLQFWGKVLMTLAIAITVTLAAVALMTTLGFATPAFLVPYITAVQSNTIVSAVLNFVAAKLTLDLNAAAAVTVAATAGAFGMFGKGLHMAGAPTSLKRDLDKAAQDMEAALRDTDVARSTAPAMR